MATWIGKTWLPFRIVYELNKQMGRLLLLASQFNMHHPHQTVWRACCAASSAAFCSSASRSVSYQLPSCLDKGRFNKQPFTKELAKLRHFRNQFFVHPSPAIFGPFFLSRWWCRKWFPAINAKLVRILVEYLDIPIAITSQSAQWSSDLREGA